MKVYIYCLFENKTPIYIGKTKNDLKIRESQHKRKLKKQVEIFELDFIDENNWKFWENYWIQQFKQWGFKLINQNEGGGGLEFHREETKQKMRGKYHLGTSKKLKGIKRPDVSKRFKGKKLKKETINKIIKSKTGHKCYKDSKRNKKIKNSNKKHYKQNSERNKKISNKLKGRKADWMKLRNKPVYQFDKQDNFIKEWNSASEIGKFFNKNSSSISECCNEKRKSAYGYKWKFKLTNQ